MILALCSIIVSIFFLWLYQHWKNVRNYWKNKGVPHNPPHPILGSLTFLQRQNPAIWMKKMYEDFKSPYVGIWLFWRPGLVVNSPEIARRILVKDSDIFRNRFLSSGKTDPVGALNVFTVNDPTWSFVRRRLTTVFTAAKLRKHNEITLVKSEDLIKRIMDEITKSNPTNLRTICSDYTTDVIGESAFGILCETTKTGRSVIKGITSQFMAFNFHRGLCWSSIFFFPELVDVFRFSFFPKKSIVELRQIYRSIVQLRGGYEKEITDVRDILDALLKLKQDAATENEGISIDVSEDLLLAQAAALLLGGFETTGATMSWIIYMLAWHPQYQQILYEELLAAKQQLGDKHFDLNTLANLTHLTCVIKETLRMYPPMGWLDRLAAKDYRIDDKLTIKAGTVVYVNAVGMQMDPEYFPEPFVFKPDRFLPENEKNITPYVHMPFGEGPRICIGMRFAYQTMRQGVSSIIMNYEVKPLPDSPKPVEIKMEKNGLFYLPNDERMMVEFVPRKKV